jgi:flagellar motor protein MotB
MNSALLSSEGYEESQPKDIYESLAGRARNRRVG